MDFSCIGFNLSHLRKCKRFPIIFWQFANTYNDVYCNEVHFNTQDNMNFVIKVRKLNNMFTVCYFEEKNYLYLVFYMRKKITEMVIKQSTLYTKYYASLSRSLSCLSCHLFFCHYIYIKIYRSSRIWKKKERIVYILFYAIVIVGNSNCQVR